MPLQGRGNVELDGSRNVSSVWHLAARWCLQGFSPAEEYFEADFEDSPFIPEALLQVAAQRFGLEFQLVGSRRRGLSKSQIAALGISNICTGPCGRSMWWKYESLHPPPRGYIWHSHNASAVGAWLRRQQGLNQGQGEN